MEKDDWEGDDKNLSVIVWNSWFYFLRIGIADEMKTHGIKKWSLKLIYNLYYPFQIINYIFWNNIKTFTPYSTVTVKTHSCALSTRELQPSAFCTEYTTQEALEWVSTPHDCKINYNRWNVWEMLHLVDKSGRDLSTRGGGGNVHLYNMVTTIKLEMIHL